MLVNNSCASSSEVSIRQCARFSPSLACVRVLGAKIGGAHRTDWHRAFSGGRKGGTAILSGGLEWKPLSTLTAEDVQLIEARQWSVGE